TEPGKLQSFVAPLNEGPCVDHLAYVKAGTKISADGPKWIIRNACHRRQDNGRPDRHLTERDRLEFTRLGGGHISIDYTPVNRLHGSNVTNNLEFQLPAKHDKRCNKMARL